MYLGDFDFGSTVFFKFTTVNSTGAVAALSSGGVTVYRDGSTVQDTTGVTLTAGFDTVTGLNQVQVDMSTAGFYSSAGSYVAIISSGAASENLTGYVLAHWSLLDRSPLTSTAGLETLSTVGLETLSTLGIETLSTAGLETVSTLGLETVSSSVIAPSVWNATRASYTPAGSFGQLVSTSTTAPDQWVAGPFSTHSTAGLETLSSAGLETLSTVGLETISSALVAASVWNATRASYTAAGSFGQLVSTSTAAPSIWANTAAAGGGSSDVNVVQWGGSTVENMPLDSTAGLETLSTLGIETVSSALVAASIWSATRSSFTAAGSFGEIVSSSTAAPDQWVAGPFSTHSTAGLETLSTIGIETLSTVGLETLSTAGLETISSGLVADAVWDEILTGVTHNIATSAGRRLRALQDFAGYETGAVWVDTVGGSTTTDDFESGTVNNPVNDLVLARTIADSVGLKIIHILPGSSDSLTQAWDDFEIVGHDYVLDFGGQSVDKTLFSGGRVEGTFAGNPRFEYCTVNAITGPGCEMAFCGLATTAMTANAAGDWFIDACYSKVAGTATPSFDFGVSSSDQNINLRHYSGGIEIQNMGSTGTDQMSLEGHGQLVLNANCSSGTIAIRGNFTVTDNAGGAVTLSEDARIDVGQINDQVVDGLSVDTYAEPAGVPAATASLADKIGYPYMALRNKITVSSSAKVVHNNAGATLWGKNLSQDSTSSTGVYTEAQASTST